MTLTLNIRALLCSFHYNYFQVQHHHLVEVCGCKLAAIKTMDINRMGKRVNWLPVEAHLEIGSVLGIGKFGDGFPLLGHHTEHLQHAKTQKLTFDKFTLLSTRGSKGGVEKYTAVLKLQHRGRYMIIVGDLITVTGLMCQSRNINP